MAGGKCVTNPGGGFGTVGGHSVTWCRSQIPIWRTAGWFRLRVDNNCHREEPPLGGDVAISFHSLRIRLKTQENEALSADFNGDCHGPAGLAMTEVVYTFRNQ